MNTEAFDESWSRHAAGLRKLLRELLGDAHAAEDFAQQTWLTALRRPPEGVRGFGAWLRRVAARHARDHARGEHRRERREQIASDREAAEAPDSLVRFERIELVVRAIRLLSERNREIVLLRYYDDLPPASIAARLALPVATVKTRLRRSLAELRRRLEGRAFPAWVWLGGVTMTLKSKAGLAAAVIAAFVLTGALWLAVSALGPSHDTPVSEVGALIASGETQQITDVHPNASRVESSADVPPPETAIAEPSTFNGILLQAVERSTGEPVAGAQVMLADWARVPFDPIASERAGLLDEDEETRFTPRAEKLTTDERGEARLPPFRSSSWISVRKGDLRASLYPAVTTSRTLRVELEPEKIVRVRVVDAAGAPRAGVAVGLCRMDGRRSTDCFCSASTLAPEGAREFRNLERWSWWSGRAPIAATFAFPLLDPQVAGFDAQSSPRHDVELVLPATGSVRVRLVDERGEPFTPAAFVALRVRRPDPEYQGGAWRTGSQCLEATHGEALFPHVGLGLGLTAYLCVLGRTHEIARLDLEGPSSAGETTEVVLRAGPRMRALVGCFVDETGALLRDVHVQAVRHRGSELPMDQWLRIGADGRFRLLLEEPPLAEGADDIRFASLYRSDRSDPQRMWTGRIDLTGKTYPPGDHDLGAVTLAGSPPLASGVIVSEDGEPLPGEVLIERWAVRDGKLQWSRDYFPQTADVQPNGEFSLYGHCEPGLLRIRARREGFYQEEPEPFVIGEAGLRLVLRAAAAIEGHVLLDEGVSPALLQIRAGGTAWPRDRAGVVLLEKDGRFRIADLHAGSAHLRICLNAQAGDGNEPPPSAELLRLEDLTLRAGETCADERLRAIDLRGLLYAVRFTVSNPDGALLANVQIAYRPSGRPNERWMNATTTSEGYASFVVRSLPIEAHIGREGYRMVELPAVDRDASVVLERGITVAVELDEGFRVAPEGTQIILSVEGSEQTRFPAGMSGEEMMRIFQTQRRTLGLPAPLRIGDRLRHELVLPGPGEYTIWIQMEGTDEPSQGMASTLAELRFTVPPQGLPEAVRLPFSAERVEQGLRSIRAHRKSREK